MNSNAMNNVLNALVYNVKANWKTCHKCKINTENTWIVKHVVDKSTSTSFTQSLLNKDFP